MRWIVVLAILLGTLWFFHEPVKSVAHFSSVVSSRMPVSVPTSISLPSTEKVARVRAAMAQRLVRSREFLREARKNSVKVSEDEVVERSMRISEKLGRVWDKRRAQIFDRLDLTRDQLFALEEARVEHQKDFEKLFRDFSASGPQADAEIEAWGKEIDRLHEDYDRYVRSVVGREKFETLKKELAIFNKRIESKMPQKVLFISPW